MVILENMVSLAVVQEVDLNFLAARSVKFLPVIIDDGGAVIGSQGHLLVLHAAPPPLNKDVVDHPHFPSRQTVTSRDKNSSFQTSICNTSYSPI